MKRIDDFLTGKVQALWRGGLVYRDTGSGRFYLERPGADGKVEVVELGSRFHPSRRALYQLLEAERARRAAERPQREGGRA